MLTLPTTNDSTDSGSWLSALAPDDLGYLTPEERREWDSLTAEPQSVCQLRADPAHLFVRTGRRPDEWQAKLLRDDPQRALLLCCRQSGKSTLAAALALHVALLYKRALVLLLSPTLRQCFDADTVVLDRQGRAMRICDHPDAWSTGVRHVKRYTVWGGASVCVTDNHPLWSEGGWTPAGSLKVGDRIAVLSAWDNWGSLTELRGLVPRGWRSKGRMESLTFPVTEALGKLLGYIASDGCVRDSGVSFTNTRGQYLDEVAELAEAVTGIGSKRTATRVYFTVRAPALPGHCATCNTPHGGPTFRRGRTYYVRCGTCDAVREKNPARHRKPLRVNRMLDLMRLVHWDHDFPTDVFAFPRHIAAAFVNRAWAGDGCVRVNKNGFPEVFLACENETYARYFQLLLLKFGVRSRVKAEWMTKSTKWFYRLVINGGRLNVEQFFAAVGPIFGKERKSQEAVACGNSGTRNRIIDYHPEDHRGEDGEVLSLARIVRIEDVGERPVWDISVPGKGWLIAQGIKAHNSGELFRDKVLSLYRALERPYRAVQRTQLTLALANGSRIVSLPGEEGTVRGFSGVALLVIDEAARVADDLYRAVRPMLAVSGGRLVALSTPFGRRGWFAQEWHGEGAWERVRITAEQCPRITPAFLADERRALGEDWYRQEYGCEFVEGGTAPLFPADWLDRAAAVARALAGQPRQAVAIGCDPGEGQANTAWAVVDARGLIELLSFPTADTSVVTGRTLALVRQYDVKPERCLFDRGGGGQQHADRLRAQGYPVRTVAFGEAVSPEPRHGVSTLAERRERVESRTIYRNRRAELYGTLRHLLDPAANPQGFGLPAEYTELRRQLGPIPLLYDGEGRMELLPKTRRDANDTRPTLQDLCGKSPDEADAVALAVWALTNPARRPKAGAL
jgi:LAGLIDADG-like domain